MFIKLCAGEWNTIPAEAYLARYGSFKSHPTILHFELEPFSWIATEFIPTKPLDRLQRSVDVRKLILQMTAILDEMNENGIIHRDLRPENICLNDNGQLVLIDFGWAIYKDRNWEKSSYGFIEKILNQQYRNEEGKFDDALSAFLSFKAAFPSISDEELKPIIDRIGRLVA